MGKTYNCIGDKTFKMSTFCSLSHLCLVLSYAATIAATAAAVVCLWYFLFSV